MLKKPLSFREMKFIEIHNIYLSNIKIFRKENSSGILINRSFRPGQTNPSYGGDLGAGEFSERATYSYQVSNYYPKFILNPLMTLIISF